MRLAATWFQGRGQWANCRLRRSVASRLFAAAVLRSEKLTYLITGNSLKSMNHPQEPLVEYAADAQPRRARLARRSLAAAAANTTLDLLRAAAGGVHAGGNARANAGHRQQSGRSLGRLVLDRLRLVSGRLLHKDRAHAVGPVAGARCLSAIPVAAEPLGRAAGRAGGRRMDRDLPARIGEGAFRTAGIASARRPGSAGAVTIRLPNWPATPRPPAA